MSADLVISLWAGADKRTVGEVTATIQQAADDGFDGVWLPQTLSVDALTALAVAGHVVPKIQIGTAVVPIQGRHPIPMFQQAMTVAQAVGPGRFTLGIGVTHALVSEGFFGIPYNQSLGLCREQLAVLNDLLAPEHKTGHEGEHITARITTMIEAPRPSLMVAALGPKMLELAGSQSDGTITWMCGPDTLAKQIVPAISDAAARAGRPAPRVVAGLPVCVTDDVPAARERVRPRIEMASAMPSYKRMLGGEGLSDLADLAIVGDADTVQARVRELAGSGVTELMADVFGTPEEIAATRAALTSLASLAAS